MKKAVFSMILAAVMIFSAGCHRSGPQENQKVVLQITVTSEQNGELIRQVYKTPEKMRQILNSIRSLGQKSTPTVDPDTIQSQTYSITLTHSDGSHRLYQAKSDRFIRRDRDPWQQADPKRMESLTFLLQNLPGDEPPFIRQGLPRTLPKNN